MTVMTSQRNADLLRRLPEVLHCWIRARGDYLVSLDQLRSLVTSAGVVFKPVSARSCFGLYAVMAVMVTSSSVGFWFVILVRRLLARMSRPR